MMHDKSLRKGFTLVELLAVIVILAIIMIIAIPSVLETVETARQKTFNEFMQKVYSAGQEKFLVKKEFEGLKRPSGYEYLEYVFDIKEDLGLTNTGGYKGIVSVIFYGHNYATTLRNNGWDIDEGTPYYDIRLMDEHHYSYIRTQNKVTPENMQVWSFDEVISEDSEWVEASYSKDNYIAYLTKNKDHVMANYIGVDGVTNDIFLNKVVSSKR